MRVLALSGKRFSGKDTFAAALVRHGLAIGVEVVPHAFAAESKRLLVARQAELGVAVDLERLTTDRSYKEQWRSKLTELTVAAIAADPLVFCRAVADRIDRQTKPHVVPLVTDVRLLLEVTHLRARFDLWLVRIARGEEARARSGWLPDPSADAHRTETELDDPALWDERALNDGDLDALDVRAGEVLRAWLARGD